MQYAALFSINKRIFNHPRGYVFMFRDLISSIGVIFLSWVSCPRAYQPPSCLIELQQLPYLSLVTLSVTCSMASISLFPSLAPSQRRLFIVMHLCCVVLRRFLRRVLRFSPPLAPSPSISLSSHMPLTYSAVCFILETRKRIDQLWENIPMKNKCKI